MGKLLKIGMIVFAVAFSMACEEAGEDLVASNLEQRSDTVAQGSAPASSDYYFISRDMRKCMYPMCGGYFLSAVNRTTMRCVNGKMDKRCYMADADFSGLKISDSDLNGLFARSDNKLVVFHGKVEKNVIGSSGTYGRLVVDKAFSAVTEALPGVWDRLYVAYDNGIRCVKAPCPNLDDIRLNYDSSKLSITGVNYKNVVNATEKQLEAASQALFNGGVVIAGYHDIVVNYLPKRRYELVATQIYLPVEPSHDEQEVQYCGSRGLEPCPDGLFCKGGDTARDVPGTCRPQDYCESDNTVATDCAHLPNYAPPRYKACVDNTCTSKIHKNGYKEECGGFAGVFCEYGLQCQIENGSLGTCLPQAGQSWIDGDCEGGFYSKMCVEGLVCQKDPGTHPNVPGVCKCPATVDCEPPYSDESVCNYRADFTEICPDVVFAL